MSYLQHLNMLKRNRNRSKQPSVVDEYIHAVKSNSPAKVFALFQDKKWRIDRYITWHPKRLEVWRYTTLHYAVTFNAAKLVDALIEAGANVNLQAKRTLDWEETVTSTLHLACSAGKISMVEKLLVAGSQVNGPAISSKVREEEGGYIDYKPRNVTSLQWLVDAKHVSNRLDIMKILLRYGANPSDSIDGGEAALYKALSLADVQVAILLLQASGSPNPQKIVSSRLTATPHDSSLEEEERFLDDDDNCSLSTWDKPLSSQRKLIYSMGLQIGYRFTIDRGLQNLQKYLANNLESRLFELADKREKLNFAHFGLENVENGSNCLQDSSLCSFCSLKNCEEMFHKVMDWDGEHKPDIVKYLHRQGLCWLRHFLLWNFIPQTLKRLCCLAIRKKIGSVKLYEKVASLPLPSEIIGYVMFDSFQKFVDLDW